MAVTPKTVRKKPAARKSASTLSAAEALKAAESAIATPVKPVAKAKAAIKPPAPKPAVKSVEKLAPAPVAPAPVLAVKPVPVPAPEPAPAAVAAAPRAEIRTVEPVVTPTPPQTELPKSLSSKAGPQEPTLLPAKEGTKMMNDVIETGKKFAEETKAKLESAYADLNEKAKANVEKSTKVVEELSDIAKGNVEALVESGKIAAKGFETLGQEAVDYGKKSFEKATASLKSLSTVKTPTEFFQLQSQFFSSSFDEFTKEAAKGSEALIKLAGDVASPLTARVTVMTEKVKSLAA